MVETKFEIFSAETSNRGNSVSFQAFSLIFSSKLASDRDEAFELSFVCLSEKSAELWQKQV